MMNKSYIIIGPHVIQITSESENLMNFFNGNFQFLKVGIEVKSDLSITLKEGYGVPFIDYEVLITKERNQIIFSRADYRIETDLEYKNANICVHDELSLKHALMNLYSSFIVYRNWGLLIHSSCAIESGGAHIFSGQSGAGKSTVARLSYPRELLSDEATLVKITPDGVTVYDSPFRSELDSTRNIEKSCQLASVQILNQSLQNKREMVSKSDALLMLMDKVFYWAHDSGETKKILRLLKQLVEHVPVYKLYFQKNERFWELIS
jgi:hypothetical protein